ncbi:vam6/Vps39 protein-like [Tropilaelaps mercedesae]|uniref:Vam6/Vps39 protein-like n=1 Tax=Tropilaelaps mercedesae TaxID=418985 RepID=A0A1V9X223_9ACAR|nr:vam6/Vps39 protein-like [Tropilaelaps mercedesae]
MYKAYSLESVLQNLPHTFSIECAAVHKDTLLVGTKQGQLATFRVTVPYTPNAEGPLDVQLIKTDKSFSKKPINQLVVVEDHDLLISLSDQTVNVHSIAGTFIPLQQFEKATTFACGTQRVERHNDGSEEARRMDSSYTMVRLCVAQRRKIQLFIWKQSEMRFVNYAHEQMLPDIPRTIVWSSEEHLIIGFKAEYILLRTDASNEIDELFNVGRQSDTLIVRLTDDRFAMLLEKKVNIVSPDGAQTQKFPIYLSEVPVSIAYDYPYLMALSTAGVEVQTINPRLAIQDVQITQTPKPLSLIVWKSGKVFVVSTNNVWCLVRTQIDSQLQVCKDRKQYHLALKLSRLLDVPDKDKALCEYHIQSLLAFELFATGQFRNAFKLFEKIQTDPLLIIGLFPSLLKERYRKKLLYSEPVPNLSESQLEAAMSELLVYLSSARSIANQSEDSVNLFRTMEGINVVRPKKQLLQIIDTTQLHLYIKIKPNLVATLLRFKDNQCHLEESEAILKEHNKFDELILLYEQKGAHRKALQVLSEQALVPSSPLHGHERTVAHLQRLSSDHFDLILEYAKWVIDAFPDDGLKIFTENKCGREQLPRDRVIQFLGREAPALIMNYLEHVILTWKDDNIQLHNMLIHKYREQILRMADGDLDDPVVMSLREKLISFLRMSNRYTLSMFPQYFLNDKLYLECAIVMGKLGRHQDALTIYIHVLCDLVRAEAYCLDYYCGNKVCDRDVFVILLRLYITPAEICLKALDISAPAATSGPPNITDILNLLDRHVDKVDPLRVIEMLPSEVPLGKLVHFITKLLETQSTQLSRLRVHNALLLSDNTKLKQLKLELEKFSVIIDDLTLCDICQRRINRSVFVQTAKGQIVHYACHNKTFLRADSTDD